jgi:hypothetical protein
LELLPEKVGSNVIVDEAKSPRLNHSDEERLNGGDASTKRINSVPCDIVVVTAVGRRLMRSISNLEIGDQDCLADSDAIKVSPGQTADFSMVDDLTAVTGNGGLDGTLLDRLLHRKPSGRSQDACRSQSRCPQLIDSKASTRTRRLIEISV